VRASTSRTCWSRAVRSLRALNLTIRFALELCLLAAFGYWAVNLGGGRVVEVVRAVAAIAGTVVVWGVFIAPKAPRLLPRTRWVTVQVGLFGLGALALGQSASWTLGIAFLAVTLGNLALVVALGDAPS
jgi:Protein of unknown function (DUF2568)